MGATSDTSPWQHYGPRQSQRQAPAPSASTRHLRAELNLRYDLTPWRQIARRGFRGPATYRRIWVGRLASREVRRSNEHAVVESENRSPREHVVTG